MIPILDLVEQYKALKTEILAAVESVLDSGSFIMGPNVEAFEREIAAYLGAKNAISVNSGTDALHLALRALGVGPGDEVITSPFTFVATTEAISIVGATPVFADIDPNTYNIDASQIEACITPRTRAIMPVHLYGLPANLAEIQSLARRYSLAVVEDCAQAIGAEFDHQKVGTLCDVGCFSFFPSKNLGAYGDGGLITTDDSQLADRIRALRLHGGRRKYYHEELGINSRLDELQAAILRVKLTHLDRWISARRGIAQRYTEAFRDDIGITQPLEFEDRLHVYHQYTVRVDNRDEVRKALAEEGIQTMVYYPVPLHQQDVNRALASYHQTFPNSEKAAKEVLSLPMYPELNESNQWIVINAVQKCVGVLTSA